MVTIQVLGKEHSGKGHLMALIAKLLSEHGINVHLQGAETHNKDKLEKPLVELAARVAREKVVITELQTGV